VLCVILFFLIKIIIYYLCVLQADRAGAGDDVVERAASSLDLLRNGNARVVMYMHKLLGDPAVVENCGAPQENVRLYYIQLDAFFSNLLNATKHWLGGAVFTQNKCAGTTRPPPTACVCSVTVSCILISTFLIHISLIAA